MEAKGNWSRPRRFNPRTNLASRWRCPGLTNDRNWSLKMNKKQWRKALYMVLSDKASSSNFIVFSEIAMPAAKTKDMVAMLKGINGKVATKARKFLFVLPKVDTSIARSSANLKNVKVISANSLNLVDLLKHDAVLVPEASLAVIEKTYLK